MAHARGLHVHVALLHLLHQPLQGRGGFLRLGDDRGDQVRDALVGGQLHHLRVHQDQADFLRCGSRQKRDQHGVHKRRLTGTGGTGHQQVRHLLDRGGDEVALNVLAQSDEHRVVLRGNLRRVQHVAQPHHFAVCIGHFDTHGGFAGDRGEQAHVVGGHGVGEVGLQVGDLGDLHTRPQLHLVAGHCRSAGEAGDLGVDLEFLEDVGDRLDHAVVGLGACLRRVAREQQFRRRQVVVALRDLAYLFRRGFFCFGFRGGCGDLGGVDAAARRDRLRHLLARAGYGVGGSCFSTSTLRSFPLQHLRLVDCLVVALCWLRLSRLWCGRLGRCGLGGWCRSFRRARDHGGLRSVGGLGRGLVKAVVVFDLVGEVEEIQLVIAVGRVALHRGRAAQRRAPSRAGRAVRACSVGCAATSTSRSCTRRCPTRAAIAGGAALAAFRDVVQVVGDVAVRIQVVVGRVRIGQHPSDQVLDVVVRLAHGDSGGLQRTVDNHQAKQRDCDERGESGCEHPAGEGAKCAAGEFAFLPRRRVAGEDVDQAEHANSDDGKAQRDACAHWVGGTHVEHQCDSDADEDHRQDQRTRADEPVRAGGDDLSHWAGHVEPDRTADDCGEPNEKQTPRVGVGLKRAVAAEAAFPPRFAVSAIAVRGAFGALLWHVQIVLPFLVPIITAAPGSAGGGVLEVGLVLVAAKERADATGSCTQRMADDFIRGSHAFVGGFCGHVRRCRRVRHGHRTAIAGAAFWAAR